MIDQQIREFEFTDDDFQSIALLAHDMMGLKLAQQKKYMVYARLSRRLRKLSISNFADYLEVVKDSDSGELQHMINAVTTNVTGFFREGHHFDHLAQTVLPFLIKNNAHDKRMRFWSAGCSTGMEAYSMALTIAGMPALRGWDIKILATDIDTNVLKIGSRGVYPEAQAARIPPALAAKFVTSHPDNDEIEMDQAVRDLVHFKHLNLMDSWPLKGPFDVIFCRNVVIYFDKKTQVRLFDRFADVLKPGQWLYIGHSENLFDVTDRFEMIGNTIYRKR